jgi:hypothetical protein
MKNFFKLFLSSVILVTLSGCYYVSQENIFSTKVHKAFIKNIEIPYDNNDTKYQRTFSIENDTLFYSITTNSYDDCFDFLSFHLNSDNIYWDSISLFYRDSWDVNIKDFIIPQNKFKNYYPEEYCNNDIIKISFNLNKNNNNVEEIKNLYLQQDEAKALIKYEIEELKYLMELYNMFMINRDIVIKENSIGGREIYPEFRKEQNTQKQDRIRLYVDYNNVSKKFCTDVVNVLVNNTNNKHYHGVSINSLDFENIYLNDEALTIYYMYNTDNVCHSNNSFKFVMYNEFDE